MTHAILTTCAMIAAIVVTATAGDILTASAMRQVGDLDVIRAGAPLDRGRHRQWPQRHRQARLVRQNELLVALSPVLHQGDIRVRDGGGFHS